MASKSAKKAMTVWLPKKVKDQLDEEHERSRISKTGIVELALIAYFKAKEVA